jgi:hypothetical protein
MNIVTAPLEIGLMLFQKVVLIPLRPVLKQIVQEEASHYLDDIEWRYKQARDLLREVTDGNPESWADRQITAEDMNTLQHHLTGYTTTPNVNAAGSAAPGSFRWQALHIVYSGVDYTVTDGASLLKYHSFIKANAGAVVAGAATVAMASSNTKPVLGTDDILLFINNNGTPIVAASSGAGSLPPVVADGSIDNAALASGAVYGDRISDTGIGAGKLGAGAITLGTQFANNVISSTQLAVAVTTSLTKADNAATQTALGITNGNVTAASTAAGVADGKAVAANTAAGVADGKAVAASTAAGVADGKAVAASTAAGVADGKAVAAQTAATTSIVGPGRLNILTHVLY